MKVLITGAAGRVGSVISSVLHEAGLELRLTDRRVRKNLPKKVEVMNLLDRDGVYRVVDEADAVVHLGNHPYFSDNLEAQTVYGENCQMNMNVFTAARELGVKKVIFISSVQVINGDRKYHSDESRIQPSMLKYLPLDGDTPPNPRNPYSLSKRAGELLMEHWVAPEGIESVTIRLPWTSHPDWWRWLKRKGTSTSIQDHSLLDECFTYLHADDAARLVLACLRTSLPGYRQYFPAARTPATAIPIAELIRRFYGNVPLRQPVETLTSLVDIRRITEETGWAPKYDLHESD